jgi:hypothetical protein
VAGVPIEMIFNSTTLEFQLSYQPRRSITAPTEILVPSLRYTEGYTVTALPAGVVWNAVGQHVYVTYSGPDEDFPDIINVTISPN